MRTVYPTYIEDSGGGVRIEGYTEFPTSSATPQTLRSFAFTYQTAGLAAGVTIYTPQVGDVIYDIGICVTTAFNGTTPLLDVGTFNGGNVGLFGELAAGAVDGSKVYAGVTDNAGLTTPNTAMWLQAAVGSHGAAGTAAYVSTPIIVTAANPILLVGSQSGQKGGTAIGGTAGAGTVFVLTGTPLSF